MSAVTWRQWWKLSMAAVVVSLLAAAAHGGSAANAPEWHRAAARWQYSSASSVPVWEVLDMRAPVTAASRAANVSHPTTVAAVPLPLPPGTACRELLIDLPLVRQIGRFQNRRIPVRATFHLWRGGGGGDNSPVSPTPTTTTTPSPSPTPTMPDLSPPTLPPPPPLGVPYQAAPPVASVIVAAPEETDWTARDNGHAVDLGLGSALYEVSIRRFRLDLVGALGEAGLVVREGEPLALGVSVALERAYNASDHSMNEVRWATVATRNAPPLQEASPESLYRFVDRGGAFYRAHPELVNWTSANTAEPIVSQFLVHGTHQSDSQELAWALYGHCTSIDDDGAVAARFPDWSRLAEGDADRADDGTPVHAAKLYASYSEDSLWKPPVTGASPSTADGTLLGGLDWKTLMVTALVAVGIILVIAALVAGSVYTVRAVRRWRWRRSRRSQPVERGGSRGVNATFNFKTQDDLSATEWSELAHIKSSDSADRSYRDASSSSGGEAVSLSQSTAAIPAGIVIGIDGGDDNDDGATKSKKRRMSTSFFGRVKRLFGMGSRHKYQRPESETPVAAAPDDNDPYLSQDEAAATPVQALAMAIDDERRARAEHVGAAALFDGASASSRHSRATTRHAGVTDFVDVALDGKAGRSDASPGRHRKHQRRHSSASAVHVHRSHASSASVGAGAGPLTGSTPSSRERHRGPAPTISGEGSAPDAIAADAAAKTHKKEQRKHHSRRSSTASLGASHHYSSKPHSGSRH